MNHLLTTDEQRHHADLVHRVESAWAGTAADWERLGTLPDDVVRWCADEGLMGAALPAELGGGGATAVRTGLLYEALGRVSASLASYVNVHGMAAQTVAKWGTEEQWREVMPGLATGKRAAAICMTEPGAGSDLSTIGTELTERDGKLVLNGGKVFITCGELADVFLVFAQRAGHSTVCLVERDNPGLVTRPMGELLGLRAAALAEVDFRDCVVPERHVVGRDGFGLSILMPHALEHGRHAVAWMALGMLQAVVSEAAAFVAGRRSFGRHLVEHGQVQSLVTRMGTDLEAAKLMCLAASRAVDDGARDASDRILMAKYFTCRVLEEHAAQAVQLLASRGVLEAGRAARAYRDSKVLNIIEGTTQIVERMLAPSLLRTHAKKGL
ncbi:acyl-CoA dehydrogenase family protein [Streptomyces sp. NPDC050732]|uniref:acyl-CoA dehydrogenase family protein n=1 Tax=Streptomyces sp. NPDC050732 TaxID=3154632 RepID=UPI00341CBF83